MRSLVKINDLEEQVEPPLSGEIRASSSTTYREEEARLAQQLSPGGGNEGTNVSIG